MQSRVRRGDADAHHSGGRALGYQATPEEHQREAARILLLSHFRRPSAPDSMPFGRTDTELFQNRQMPATRAELVLTAQNAYR